MVASAAKRASLPSRNGNARLKTARADPVLLAAPAGKLRNSRAGQHVRGRASKCTTGIEGFDEITGGGLPRNRTTLVSGGAGTGKTLFGLDFLVQGAAKFNEPGVLLAFEETEDELYSDVAALSFDLHGLVKQGKIQVVHIALTRSDFLETGSFNLEGLFVRLDQAIDATGAKRVVIDSVESLFAGIADVGVLRLEVKRLFRWLQEKGVTAVVTAEPAPGSLSRHGLEEYISDCIVLLDHRVKDQVAIRRLRVVKYRGSSHATNEYPFVISDQGLSVIATISAGLEQPGTTVRVSTGVASLNKLFTGSGYTKGSTVLLSGTAGTGKTSLAAAFALAACRRGGRCLFVSYEESAGQLMQNLLSIGIDLRPHVKNRRLRVVSTRPSFVGLERHLIDLYRLIEEFKPDAVVVDPLTSLMGQGSPAEIQATITRLIDLLKGKGVTGVFTSLVSSGEENETSGEIGVSSIIDTWIVVRELEEAEGRRRIRGIYVVKSRGMNHSSDIHKLILADSGISVVPMTNPAEPRKPDIVKLKPKRR